MTSDGRGGRRQRRFAKKDGLNAIDREAIADLLEKLAPKANDARKELALKIVVKGVELFREHAPVRRTLKDSVQKNRRAMKKWMDGKTAAGYPFESFVRVSGRLFASGRGGIYEILDVQIDNPIDGYEGLEEAIAGPQRAYTILQQRVAGFKHINPNIPYSGGTPGIGETLLDAVARPRDWEGELAGYVYLAITKGMGLKASTTDIHQFDPVKVKTGANYCRLLMLALIQSGIQPPAEKLRPLMSRGKKEAEELLAPAITHPDGRSYSAFAMMFPDVDA